MIKKPITRKIARMKKKKAQIWGLDLMIALVIFFAAILVFYYYSVNFALPKSEIARLVEESVVLSNNLLSEGFPSEWNKDNVQQLGILSSDRINKTKLTAMAELAESDYVKTKSLLNTRHDYFIFFKEEDILNFSRCGIGHPDVIREEEGKCVNNISTIKSKNLVSIKRLVIYENRPVKMLLYLWEK